MVGLQGMTVLWMLLLSLEVSRDGLPASSNNALLRPAYFHQHNGKHADCVVTGGDSLPASVNEAVARIGYTHSKHLFDVRIECSCSVTANNVSQAKLRSANGADPLLTKAEADKYEKHETPYAGLSFGLFEFQAAVSSFRVVGPTLTPILLSSPAWMYLGFALFLSSSSLQTFPQLTRHFNNRNTCH
jgi:hypothetical protein